MKRFFSSAILTIFCLFIPCLLLAQQEDVTLEEVVVTATRDVEEVRKIPANVTVITRKEIERSNAQVVVDVLRDEVGVVVRDFYGNGKAASVDVRGLGETAPLNTLVLVDGRRVNEIDLSGVDWTQIPLDQIERIEIVRGPGSVLYGDNAVGGVINIITKKPEKAFSAQAGVALGSYHFNKENGSVGGTWGPLGAILNFGYNATEGYRDNGWFRAKDIGGKITYDANENIVLSFDGSLHRDNQGLPGGIPKTLLEEDRRATLSPEDKAETDDGYLDFGMKARLWDVGRMEADLSYRERQVEDFFRSYSFEDERNLRTWGFTPRFITEKMIRGHGNKLTVGLDLYRSESEVDYESFYPGFAYTDYVEVKKKSVGAYFLDQFSILENLILSLGYRYEWVDYDLFQRSSNAQDTLREGEPAWNIGIDYLFDRGSSAFVSVKRSFRFPVSDELIQYYPTLQVNPSMKPQTGYHYETGFRLSFSDQIETRLTLFWANIEDEIFFNPETFENVNFPKTRRTGVEIGATARPFSWLALWGNYGYTKPLLRKDPFSDNDIPGVPRNKGSLGAEIECPKGFLLSGRVNAVGSSYLISDWGNQFEKLDGYYTVDVKLSYVWRGLRAFVGVNNLTNQEYEEWAVTNATGTSQVFYPSPERTFIGGISYAF
jgi:iron complex outermembrane receptor protein